jgi:hypothetical protein
MRKYAWLNFAYGVWHLVAENDNNAVRFWKNRESAITELQGEGWILLGPFPRRCQRRWHFDRTCNSIRLIQ